MSEHIVKSYEEQLQNLTNTIVKMGGLAESQFANSVNALLKRDEDLADKIAGKDLKMNEFDIKIENQVIDLIPFHILPDLIYSDNRSRILFALPTDV